MKERCELGCGCGKGKKISRPSRLKTAEIKQMQAKRRLVAAKKPKKLGDLVTQRNSAICMSCEQTKQTQLERKRGIRVCHKSARLIKNIIRDTNYSCPLGKWKKTK